MARHNIEDAVGQIHHAEAVLETAVRRAGIDHEGERQLMSVPKTLEGTRVDHSPSSDETRMKV